MLLYSSATQIVDVASVKVASTFLNANFSISLFKTLPWLIYTTKCKSLKFLRVQISINIPCRSRSQDLFFLH